MRPSAAHPFLAVACATTLLGCTVTATGVAVKAPMNPDDAIVALMDTGSYSTTAGPPPGAAGQGGAAVAEAHRIGEFMIGPWQVNATLTSQDYLATFPVEDAGAVAVVTGSPLWPPDFMDPAADTAKAHGFLAGFATGRSSDRRTRLNNVVLRFPDADAAKAAAGEMAGIPPPLLMRPFIWDSHKPSLDNQPLDPPWRSDSCYSFSVGSTHPDFYASASNRESALVRGFTAHGPYVLYQLAIASDLETACDRLSRTLEDQQSLIDRFVPTDPAKMVDLPDDPSGEIEARTLQSSDDTRPLNGGVWRPQAWLQFEDNPVAAASLLKDAGVEWVARYLTVVYQAHAATGAARLADQFAADTAALPDTKPTDSGVPGLPVAKCFQRTERVQPPNDRLLLEAAKHAYWQFKCVARADRYAFISYSGEEKDAKQQISAQYRILSGK